MNSQLLSILKGLPNLTRNELDQVAAMVRVQLQSKTRKSTNAEEKDWILEGVLNELDMRGLFERARFRSPPKGYMLPAAQVRTQLENQIPDMSPAEKLLLGQICASSLIDEISSWRKHMLLTPDGILQRVGMIPLALDNAFPGYLRSGHLAALLRGVDNGKR